MAKVYEYILRLKDQASAQLGKIGTNCDQAKAKTASLSSSLKGLNGIMGTLGIGVGMYQFVNMMKQGVEKAQELNLAQANLKNTMLNMNTYSEQSFAKALAGAKGMASGIKYSTAEVTALQSQLRLVGNIGEKEMQRMISASADMATKFDMGLSDAGNTIAKAVNNPELMRRLGMQLKIDPAAVESIQNLARNGKEAAARLELLTIIEQKVGGAAKSAFAADPLAAYQKRIGSIKMELGQAAIKIQASLAPALIGLANIFKSLAGIIGKVITLVAENNILFTSAAVTIGILTVALKAKMMVETIQATATKVLTVAQWAFNTSLYGCPIIWIAAAVMAFVATIIYAYQKIGWFRGAILAAWEAIKGFGLLIKDFIIDRIQGILSGLGKLGQALMLFFKRDWKAAWQTAKGAAGDIVGVDAYGKAIKNAKQIGAKMGTAYQQGVAEVAANKKDKKGGIAQAVLPGQSLGTESKYADAANSTTQNVSSGGTRNTSIVINLGKLVENIRFEGNVKENAADFTRQIQEELYRVLHMAESVS